MFVPPAVHEQIQKLRITRGQAFIVTKQEKRIGHKRAIEWMVEFPEDTAQDKPEPSRMECSPRTEPEKPVPPLLTETETPDGPRTAGAVADEPKPEAEPAAADPAAPAERSAVNETPEPNHQPAADPRAQPSTGSANGVSANGNVRMNGAARHSEAGTTEKNNTSPLFRASMRAAIDALIDAESYAAGKNYCVRFSNEDLRATAISIFIAVREGYSR